MKKKTKEINYAKELRKRLVDVDFSKKPKDVSLEELKELAKKAREARERDEYKSSLQAGVNL